MQTLDLNETQQKMIAITDFVAQINDLSKRLYLERLGLKIIVQKSKRDRNFFDF